LPNDEMLDCEKFRELHENFGARLETDNVAKVCLGLGLPRNEPGLVAVD
jgi:hypothetical protein